MDQGEDKYTKEKEDQPTETHSKVFFAALFSGKDGNISLFGAEYEKLEW